MLHNSARTQDFERTSFPHLRGSPREEKEVDRTRRPADETGQKKGRKKGGREKGMSFLQLILKQRRAPLLLRFADPWCNLTGGQTFFGMKKSSFSANLCPPGLGMESLPKGMIHRSGLREKMMK